MWRNDDTSKVTCHGIPDKAFTAKAEERVTDNRRVKPTVYGEVLTRDELLMRLEEQEKEKAAKEAEKKANKESRAAKAAQKAEKKRAAKERREVIRGEKAAERALKAAEKAQKAAEKANKSKFKTLAKQSREGTGKIAFMPACLVFAYRVGMRLQPAQHAVRSLWSLNTGGHKSRFHCNNT